MKPTWTLRTYEEGDENGIVQLLDFAYAEVGAKYTLETWKWKYRRTPRNFIAVAESDGQVVGHLALIPVKMKVGRRILTACQAVELMVDPRFRHQGIFHALAEMLINNSEREDTQLWYGIPNVLSYRGLLKHGFFDLGDVRIGVRPFDTYKAVLGYCRGLERSSRAIKVLTKAIDMSFLVLSEITSSERKGIDIVKCPTFDHRISELWNRISSRLEIAIVREEEYLNWRFCERSDGRYEAFLAETAGNIVGYVVHAAMEEKGGKTGYIADILADSDDAYRTLLQFSVENLARRNVGIVRFWIPPSLMRPTILTKNGFLVSPQRMKMIARVSSSGSFREFVSRHSRWYFTAGDSDLI